MCLAPLGSASDRCSDVQKLHDQVCVSDSLPASSSSSSSFSCSVIVLEDNDVLHLCGGGYGIYNTQVGGAAAGGDGSGSGSGGRRQVGTAAGVAAGAAAGGDGSGGRSGGAAAGGGSWGGGSGAAAGGSGAAWGGVVAGASGGTSEREGARWSWSCPAARLCVWMIHKRKWVTGPMWRYNTQSVDGNAGIDFLAFLPTRCLTGLFTRLHVHIHTG
mgnify:CR=1 FL=1